MYARVARFENRNMSMVDQLIGRVQNQVREGQGPPNARGFLMLIDREGGGALGVSFFDSEEDIRAAEPAFERMGDEFPEEVRGRRLSVDVHEVVQHEGGEGAKAARVSLLEGPPDQIDEGVRFSNENVLPRARKLRGWKGFYSLVDRKTGRLVLITLWESDEARQASEQQADQLRKETAEGSGETIKGVERYEVAVSVPLGATVGSR